MTNIAAFVFGVIAIAAVLMASNRVRFDIVALTVTIASMLIGVFSIREALPGSGTSVVALISGMLTLIATTPNSVVHEELKGTGFKGRCIAVVADLCRYVGCGTTGVSVQSFSMNSRS